MPGTGPKQWYNLINSIISKNNLRPSKINAVLILDDLKRDLFTLHPIVMRCLHYGDCSYSMGLQGYNFANKSDEDIKQEILLQSNDLSPIPFELRNSMVGKLKSFVKKSVFLSKLYRTIISIKTKFPPKDLIEQNLYHLKKILELGEKPGFVILIPTKQDIPFLKNKMIFKSTYEGKKFYEFIEKNNFDFKICNLKLDDFHKYDQHSNEKGYNKIRLCIKNFS